MSTGAEAAMDSRWGGDGGESRPFFKAGHNRKTGRKYMSVLGLPGVEMPDPFSPRGIAGYATARCRVGDGDAHRRLRLRTARPHPSARFAIR